jgi:hypothetical protein
MSGEMNFCKMTLRGQAFDVLQCGRKALDDIIRTNAIEGMEKIPLSGIDQDAGDEINTCDGSSQGQNAREEPPQQHSLEAASTERHYT